MGYPHPYLVVNLLDACNKVCRHCYRTAIPSSCGFRLREGEALLGLGDASSLGTACLFAGGEPTIWQDEGLDLLSLLIRAAKHNGRVAFISNGYVFEDEEYTQGFVRRYVEECGLPLRMMFSVDFIHENYDAEGKRIPFLDNLLAGRNAYDVEGNIVLSVGSHWTNDVAHNIPLQVFESYAEQGVEYNIDDFMMWGRAAGIEYLACYVEVGARDKTSLGPYGEILARKMMASGRLGDADEFEELPNRELIRRLSVCGHAPNYTISWGRDYFYCIPQMGHDWFAISEIGRLDLDAMRSFFTARPVIKEIQDTSILGVVDAHRSVVGQAVLDEIDSMREGIRFAGCSVCLKLSREGILQEINRGILERQM